MALACTWYHPEPTTARHGVIVIPCAMGVRQTYYSSFADWLCRQGYLVVSFDYRGIGDSAPPSLRGFNATVTDWAKKDFNAVLLAAQQALPTGKLFVIGHSLGGQLPGLLPDNAQIDGMITIGAGNGYWRYNAPPAKRVVWWFWWVAVPVYTRLWGYFPGKRLRKVGDLPCGVIFEWRRWCLQPNYCVDEHTREGYQRMRCPVLCLSFTDDELMSETSIRTLHDFYAHIALEHRRIHPKDLGVTHIGHFGFFREHFQTTLWNSALMWLNQHSEEHR